MVKQFTADSRLDLMSMHLQAQVPTCNISRGSKLAELIQETVIIIIDEVTLLHKRGIEAIDRTLKDICRSEEDFGGKLLVFCGDFRQVLPIVHGSRVDTVIFKA